MTLNRFLWLRTEDAQAILDGGKIPGGVKYRMAAKWNTPVILEVVSVGHRIEVISKGEVEVVGIVVRDQRDLLWQARYEIMPWESGFQDEVRGFVKFTRVVESTPSARTFTEVP